MSSHEQSTQRPRLSKPGLIPRVADGRFFPAPHFHHYLEQTAMSSISSTWSNDRSDQINETSDFKQHFNELMTSLQSGDLIAVKMAFAIFKNDFQTPPNAGSTRKAAGQPPFPQKSNHLKTHLRPSRAIDVSRSKRS